MVAPRLPRVSDVSVTQARDILRGADSNNDGYVNVAEIDAWFTRTEDPNGPVVNSPLGSPEWIAEQQSKYLLRSIRDGLNAKNRNVDDNGDGYFNYRYSSRNELQLLAGRSGDRYLIEDSDYTAARPPQPPRPPRPDRGGNQDIMQFILMFFLMQLFGGNRGFSGGGLF